MAKEVLAIPEQHLMEVIRVIRAGIEQVDPSPVTKAGLSEWCNEEEHYLKQHTDYWSPSDVRGNNRNRGIRIRLLASQLAKLYDEPNSDLRICACLGIECSDPGCPRWWECFLGDFTPRDIARMVDIYLTIRER